MSRVSPGERPCGLQATRLDRDRKTEPSGSTHGHCASDVEQRATGCMFALLGFGLSLALWSPSVFSLHFETGNIYSVPVCLCGSKLLALGCADTHGCVSVCLKSVGTVRESLSDGGLSALGLKYMEQNHLCHETHIRDLLGVRADLTIPQRFIR